MFILRNNQLNLTDIFESLASALDGFPVVKAAEINTTITLHFSSVQNHCAVVWMDESLHLSSKHLA